MSSENAVQIRTGKLWLDDEGILHVRHEPGVVITLEDAKEQLRAGRQVSNGKRVPYLVDMRAIKFTDQAARDYFSSPEGIMAWSRVALLVGGASSAAIGNMWVAVHGDVETPSKVFSSESEAIAWLKG
jgi:hypothetical protein